METQEKLRYRAWLLAIGADRWYECVDRVERMKIVEILEEEFARAKAEGELLEKERAFLAKYGIVISDVPVQVEVPFSQEEQEKVDLRVEEQVCGMVTDGNAQATHSAVVHSGTTSSAKVQQNPLHEPNEALSRRMTKDDAQRSGPAQIEEAGEIYKHLDSRGWTGSWTWRQWNYNRVPPALEAAVYERFKQGWSKSKLAREFRLNRRTIIRICKAWQEAGPPV